MTAPLPNPISPEASRLLAEIERVRRDRAERLRLDLATIDCEYDRHLASLRGGDALRAVKAMLQVLVVAFVAVVAWAKLLGVF